MSKYKVTRKYKKEVYKVLKDAWECLGTLEFNDWGVLAQILGCIPEPRFKNALKELDKDLLIDIYPYGLFVCIDVITF